MKYLAELVECTGYSIAEIAEFLLEGDPEDLWKSKFLTHHTSNVGYLDKIMNDGELKGSGTTGVGKDLTKEVSFSTHPFWSHTETKGPTISFKRGNIEKQHKLYPPEYTVRKNDWRIEVERSWGGTPNVTQGVGVGKRGQEPLNKGEGYGPWEGELRAPSSVKFKPSDVSHITYHLGQGHVHAAGGFNKATYDGNAYALEKAQATAHKHGVKFVVAVHNTIHPSYLEHLRKTYKAPIIKADTQDFKKSDIGKHYIDITPNYAA